MKCPFCSSDNTFVVDSRLISNGTMVRRRRQCEKCKRRFSTHESLAYDTIMVIKKNGKREPFSEEKLLRSINAALGGMTIEKTEKDTFFSNLTTALYKKAIDHNGVLTTTLIGDEALIALKELSQVGYIRFASVYKEFSDVKQIIQEIKRLK